MPILCKDDAVAYLEKILTASIKEEIGTSENHKKFLHKQYHLKQVSKLFLSAPDVYFAAAIMHKLNFSRGKGEVSFIAKTLGGIAKLQQPRPKKPQIKKRKGGLPMRGMRGGRGGRR